ncbi:hypothetical protein L6452_42489 [Arctium lappa]|uniref:Uncharacterized protein n=1 Tax=Arctium lappa TaxID=4217 RepID=A0ACB8XJ05_ARCLA|nr:hypothetical protein L6452_42489 [Arctium lappa]
MASSNEWCKLFPKSGEPSRLYRFPIKDNNHMIQLDSPKFEEQYGVICEFFSNCELTQALTAFTNEFEELQITRFEKRPTSETLLQFIRMLGYNTEITRLSNFRRQHLPPIWNFMFFVLNRTLTCKLGSMDQATPEILSIMYALFFNRNLDMAGIIFDMILTSIEKKNKCLSKDPEQTTQSSKVPSITFPRFLSLIIHVAIEKLHILIATEQPKTPFYIMNNFKPTILSEGYPEARRIPHHMLNQVNPQSVALASYLSVAQGLEPVLGTPTHLGPEPGMESKSISASEGSEDPEVQSSHKSELEGTLGRETEVERDDRALEGAVNEGVMEETSSASEEDSSTSSEESEDESSDTSSKDSQREESKSSKDLEKPESSSPSTQKDAPRHIYFRTPTPSPSVTTQSNLPNPEVMVIESEVHTSNPNQPATLEVPFSTSEVHINEETQFLDKPSSQDLVNTTSTQLPQSTSENPTHDDASVAHLSPFRISRSRCPTQGQWLDLQNQGLTCLDRKINSHIHFQSYESEEEDLVENRTLRDDSPEHQGLSGSPSRDNIKTALNEGSSELEENLATCVVTNVPLSKLLTKSEFQRFCEEVRGSMKEHNFQRIDGSETSALRSENTNLRAEVSTLKTQLLDSSNRIQELEQELFRQKAESSLEIANLKAQYASLQNQASTTIDVQKALQELKDEVVATRSSSLSTDQMASISDLIKTTIQACVPTVSAPSTTPQPPPRTSEYLITKSDLASFKSAIMSRMLTCSSKIFTIAQKHKTLLDPKGKGIAEPNSPKYKRKFSGGTCSDAVKKARFDDSEDSDDDENSESQDREIKDTTAHTYKVVPSAPVQEKELERNTTSFNENRTLQTFTAPIILFASSTPGVPITPVTDATPEKIGALEEEEQQLVDFSTSSEDAFSSPERQPMVMRDAFDSESEKEQNSDSNRAEEAVRDQIEVIDVE